jgi:hypothetical protein
MVLDAGRLVEFDTPLSLLGKENSFFKHLVDQSADKKALIESARREWGATGLDSIDGDRDDKI